MGDTVLARRALAILDAALERPDAERASWLEHECDGDATLLREKLRTERLRLLKEHGLTEDAFTRLTHRVAVDDEARKAFEAALARLAEKK